MTPEQKQEYIREFMEKYHLNRVELSEALDISIAIRRSTGKPITPTLNSWLAPVTSQAHREPPMMVIKLLRAWEEIADSDIELAKAHGDVLTPVEAMADVLEDVANVEESA